MSCVTRTSTRAAMLAVGLACAVLGSACTEQLTPQQELFGAVLRKDLHRTRELLLDEQHVDVNWRSSNLAVGPVLLTAAAYGPPEMVRLLLAHGANPNLSGKYDIGSLHLAAREGNDEIVRLLISAGADLDATESSFGTNCLMVAAESGHATTVELLLQAGANPLATSKNGLRASQVADSKYPQISRRLRESEAQWSGRGDTAD